MFLAVLVIFAIIAVQVGGADPAGGGRGDRAWVAIVAVSGALTLSWCCSSTASGLGVDLRERVVSFPAANW